jgi:hypothetical protein
MEKGMSAGVNLPVNEKITTPAYTKNLLAVSIYGKAEGFGL